VPGYSIFHLETAVAESDRESLDAFLDWISTVVINRGRAACWLLQQEPVDMLMVHFQASDVLQHVLWHYLDPDHPLFDGAKNRKIAGCFFGSLDRQIGVIGECFDRQSSSPRLTAVVSDHGFQCHSRRFNLWRWLQENEFLKLDITAAADPPVDWKASRVLSTGRSNEAFLYLLESETESRQATETQLVEMLTSLCDPDTGERVISAVHQLEKLESGCRASSLPDLIVEPHGHYSVTGLYDKEEETFSTVVPGSDFHAGRHHPDGVVVLAGPGIEPRSDLDIDLIDIAPTLLSYFGIQPREDMDGRVRHELFGKGILFSEEVPHRPAPDSFPAGGAYEKVNDEEGEVYSPEEKEIIEKRLKDLGYL
jgi:predicted AlkP superfamily phosphohydrolase/phosphomutase